MVAKKLRLLSIYAKDFLVFALLLSLLSYFIYFITGNSALNIIFWFKIITTGIGIYVHQNRKAKELFFYMNNGLGKRQLMITAVAVDIGVWLLGMIILVNTSL